MAFCTNLTALIYRPTLSRSITANNAKNTLLPAGSHKIQTFAERFPLSFKPGAFIRRAWLSAPPTCRADPK